MAREAGSPSRRFARYCFDGEYRGKHIPPWVRGMRVLSAPPSCGRNRKSAGSLASPEEGRSAKRKSSVGPRIYFAGVKIRGPFDARSVARSSAESVN